MGICGICGSHSHETEQCSNQPQHPRQSDLDAVIKELKATRVTLKKIYALAELALLDSSSSEYQKLTLDLISLVSDPRD